MADWAALPADLVRCIGNRLLAASDSDIHDYMTMRAACYDWRLATDDPCRCSTSADPLRFRPRHWVMLDDDKERDVHLFFNVVTGRFIRRQVPLLRDHVLVAASGGLLVVGNREYPHAGRVLNPFTGSPLRFEVAIPRVSRLRAEVAGSDEDISLVFCSYHHPFLCAYPMAGKPSPLPFPHAAGRPYRPKNASIAAHRGHVYVADRDGQVVRCCVVTSPQQRGCPCHCNAELIISGDDESSWVDAHADRCGDRAFLVTSAGELLLVRLQWRRGRWILQAFRVDVERKAIEPVRSIGRRALFVGDRCLSLDDADRFPSLRGNCVYRRAAKHVNGVWVCRHDLADGSEERIFGLSERPFGLAEVLLNYCGDLPDAEAQIQIIGSRDLEVEERDRRMGIATTEIEG